MFLCITAISAALAQVATAETFTATFSPDSITEGGISTLTLSLTNDTGSPVSDMAFSATLPTGVTIGSGSQSNGCTGSALTATSGGDTITFSGGRLGTSASCSVTLPVTSSTVGTHTLTTGDLTSSFGNSGSATDDLTVTASSGNFTSSISPDTIDPGSSATLTYDFDVVVPSGGTFTEWRSAYLDIYLPSGVEFTSPVDASASCGGTLTTNATDGRLTFAGELQQTQGTYSCTVTARITASESGTYVFDDTFTTLNAFGSADSTDQATGTLTVNSPPEGGIWLVKSFDVAQASPGDTVTLEFSLTNTDTSNAASNIAFTDDLDAMLSGLAATALPTDPCGSGSSLTGSSSLSFSGGSLDARSSCSFSVDVLIPANTTTATFTNTTSAVTGDLGATPYTGSTASTTLKVFGDDSTPPAIAVAFTDDPVAPGDSVTMRYTLTNPSSTVAMSDLAFSHALGIDGLTIASGTGSVCNGGFLFQSSADPLTLGLSAGSLAAGADCTIDVTLNVDETVSPGDYTTTTETISATSGGNSVSNFGASDTLTVSGGATLTFTKSFDADYAQPGSTTGLTFRISSADESPSTATSISFTDDLDAFLSGTTLSGLTSDSCGGSLTGSSTLSYSGGTLAPGDSCEITLDIAISGGAAAGSYTNTTSALSATAGGEATSAAAASDSLQVLVAQELTGSSAFDITEALPGETITLTYTLTNPDSTYTYSNIAFSDPYSKTLSSLAATALPSANFCQGTGTATGSTTGTFSGMTLAPGQSCDIPVTLLVPAGASDGSYTLVTSSLTATLDGSSVTLSKISSAFSVDTDLIGLTSAFDSSTVAAGDTVDLTYTLSNNSSSRALSAIAFTEDLDGVLSGLVSSSGSVSACNGTLSGTDTLSFSGGSLAAGASCTITTTLQVPGSASTDSYSFTSSTPSATADGVTVSGIAASASLTVVSAEAPTFSKSFPDDSGAVAAGGTATLRYQISNPSGGASLSGLRFTDDLDAALSGLVVSGGTDSNLCGSGSGVSGSSEVVLSGGALEPGESCTIDLTVTIPADAAVGSYSGSTSTLTDNSIFVADAASASFAVQPAPGFSISFATSSATLGDDVTLTFSIDNSSALIAASALSFTDSLPAGMVVADTPASSTTCSGGTLTATAGSDSISYTGGTVAAGASCDLSVNVTSTASGTLSNTSGTLSSSLGTSTAASASLDIPSLTLDTPLASDNIVNASEAGSLTVSGSTTLIEDGQTVSITITDSASDSASGSANVTSDSWSTSVDVSGLADGTLLVSATVTDAAGTGSASQDTDDLSLTVTKDATAPSGLSVSFDDDAVNAANESAISFTFADAEAGASYSYTISSDGGGSDVTGSGTLAGSDDQITGLDLSGLADGSLTLSVIVTDTNDNAASAVTDTIDKDTEAPSLSFDSPLAGDDIIDSTEVEAFALSGNSSGIEDGQSVTIVATDTQSQTVSGSATVASNAWSLTLDLSSLAQGNIDLTANASDAAGNASPEATASVTLDSALPQPTLSGPDSAQSEAFTVSLSFDKSVTGFALDDLTIDNGSASDLSGSGTDYSFTVTPEHDGTVTIALAAGAAQDSSGNDSDAATDLEVTADLTGTPNPTPEPDEDGDGVPDSLESSTADRDGDGIPDAEDYDPQGYFYCEDSGQILSGGGITVSGPSGSNSSTGTANDITIVRDGSSGEYQWFALVPGTYSVTYSYPSTGVASTARLSSGTLDVTSLLPDDPAVLGSTEFGSTGVLADTSLAANPLFYDTFVIEAGDPNVLANNIPLTQCAENAITVSASSDGAEANDATPTAVSFTISQERVATQDSVITYSLSGTSSSGSDYTAPSGSVTIAAGDTEATLELDIIEDGEIEGTETVILTLTAVSGDDTTQLSTVTADLSGTANITDDDFADIQVTNDDLTAREGDSSDTGAMSFSLLGSPSAQVELAFTGDDQCSVSPASMTFTTGNFDTAQTLTITAIDDEVVEGNHSCQPTVSVTSADTRFDGYALTLAQVQISDDLVDQIRDRLTQVLKADLEQTVTAQQAYFSTISRGALSRLKQGDADLGCGTQEGFDVDGAVDIQGGNGGTSGRFGSDSYHCQSGVRRILDGSFSLTHTDDLGTQALIQFAQQRERFVSDSDLRGMFWGGYFSRNTINGDAEGHINGFGLNGGVYGARGLSQGVYLDYYGALGVGHHRYDLSFSTLTTPISATGSYDYAAAYAGAALSGEAEYRNVTLTPRAGLDLAYAVASDASVTAQQLTQVDTGQIDIPDYNGGRLFAELEIAWQNDVPDQSRLAPQIRMALTPRLTCEASSFDSSFDCGLGLGLSRDVIDLRRGLSFSFSLDYDHIDERDRLSLGFSRERRFADDQGAIVTRLSMPSREALTLEHGIRLDF